MANIADREETFRDFLQRDETKPTCLAICKAVGTTSIAKVVQELPHIRALNLFGSNFLSIEPVALLEKLERLFLKGVGCKSLSGVEGCKNIREIDASQNQITSLSELSGLKPRKISDFQQSSRQERQRNSP